MARADAVATLLGLVAIVMLGCCVANNPVLGATIDGDKRQQGQNVATVDDAPVDKEAIAVIDIGRSDEESQEDDVVSLNSDETDDYGSVEQQEVEGVSDEATGAVLNDSGANEDATARQEYAMYQRKFISRDAAERLKKKFEERGNTNIMADDYEELIQPLDNQALHTNPSIYDKKYFDYLPVKDDLASGQVFSVESDDIEFQPLFASSADEPKIFKTPDDQVDERDMETTVHRMRRDLSGPWSQTEWGFQRSPQPQYLTHQFSSPNWRQPAQQLPPLSWTQSVNDPWNNRFYGPSNVYLPAQTPAPPVSRGYFYPKPAIAFNYPSINNAVNHGTPPDNPVIQPVDLFPTRFQFEDDPRLNPPATGLPVTSVNEIPGSRFDQTTRATPNLIHNSDDQVIPPRRRPAANNPPGATTGNTRRPTPDLLHNSEDRSNVPPRPVVNQSSSPPLSVQGLGDRRGSSVAPVWSVGRIPSVSQRIPTPSFNAIQPPQGFQAQRPQQIRPEDRQAPQPSTCVWGIVNCCARNNLTIRYACFEANGCNGAFWGVNPCSSNVFDAAVQEADDFFQ